MDVKTKFVGQEHYLDVKTKFERQNQIWMSRPNL